MLYQKDAISVIRDGPLYRGKKNKKKIQRLVRIRRYFSMYLLEVTYNFDYRCIRRNAYFRRISMVKSAPYMSANTVIQFFFASDTIVHLITLGEHGVD